MVSGNKNRKCCVSDKFPAWTQPANKMKLKILLKNFTSCPTQSKNTEASKSDNEENSFAAGACAKNKPCKWVTSFPNPSSNVTFCTSYILTSIGLQDVRAQDARSKHPRQCEPTAKYCTDTHRRRRGQQELLRTDSLCSWAVLYLIAMPALKLRMQQEGNKKTLVTQIIAF